MKTDELITVLASHVGVVDPRVPARRLAAATLLGVCGALAIMAWLLGINPELASDARLPMFWVRAAFAALLAIASVQLVGRLACPGAAVRVAWGVMALPVIAIWALATIVLIDAAPAERTELVLGSSWRSCPWNIALISLPALVLMLAAVRSLAPTRLRSAGAASGALAGALATLTYTVHCPELAAPFIGVWYVLGIAIPAAIGSLIGPRVLRW